MSELRALIFDVDGTLAETERDGHRVAFNRAFQEAGLDWNWSVERYGELLAVSGGKERIRFFLDNDVPEFDPPGDRDEFITDLHALKTRHYRQLLSRGDIPLRPGVRRLMDEARANGILLAIATTSAYPNAIALLQYAISPASVTWFAEIAAGDVVPSKKPAPDIYHYVLKKIGLPPQNCLVIEDSQHGWQAAVAAGLKTVITANGYTQGQDFSNAVLAVDSLGEPDRPFAVLSGYAKGFDYFNLDLARRLQQD